MLFLECIVLIALSKITLFLIHIIRTHYNLINYFKLIYYLFWYIILSYFLHFISTSITLYYCCCECLYYVKHLEISLYFKVCYTNKIHYYYYYYYVNLYKYKITDQIAPRSSTGFSISISATSIYYLPRQHSARLVSTMVSIFMPMLMKHSFT